MGLVALTLATAACGSSSSKNRHGSSGNAGKGGGSTDGSVTMNGSDGSITQPGQDGGTNPGGVLVIDPQMPALNVVNGKAQTLTFTAKLNGLETHPVWSIDRAEIGSIDAKTGVFTTAKVGGEAIITADTGTVKSSTKITVILVAEQNGATADSTCAAGGCGGVGGEGTGPKVTTAQKTALDAKPTTNSMLSWLYPYDGTVWPLDLLAPLLQWSFDPATPADAIKLELKSEFYSYTGYFARPASLAANAEFVRHPIPQDVWIAATRSSVRATLRARITVLAGGKAQGPISEQWTIAGGALKGVVYYQSYGTKLAKNFGGAMGGDGMFGGATLAIKGGSTAPTLVAGGDGDDTKCRVCHTVSADGSRMIVQHGDDYSMSSSYALTKAGYPETPYTQKGAMGWAGLYPDGTVALGNAGPISGGANMVNNVTLNSSLLDAVTGKNISSPTFASLVTQAGMPTFSPDGKQVAFAFLAGAGDSNIGGGDESKLVVMDFDRSKNTFSNASLVYQASGGARPGWPTFLPGGTRLVFQLDLPSGNNRGEYFATRHGNRGELWYVDIKTKTAHALDRANGNDGGSMYLPAGPNSHDADSTLQFEPTVNPIVSGGYAWVVFTSRRMYGNVANIDPTWSDPRDHDLTSTPTPKKLWVAAMDLPPDTDELKPEQLDPSHPAFYLPAQELLAGNSRGYWVPEPCRADGKSCQSGDQCCAGYCARDAKTMKNLCGGEPPKCAAEFDRCETDDDCCNSGAGSAIACYGGVCSTVLPQ